MTFTTVIVVTVNLQQSLFSEVSPDKLIDKRIVVLT